MRIEILKNDTFKDESELPKTATERSTGYDITATSDPEIVGKIHETYKVEDREITVYNNIDYIQYKTNLKIAVKKDFPANIDYDVLVMPRSSVSKYNLVLANSVGLIDADYRGEILVRFKYIWQPEDYYVPVSGGMGNAQVRGIPNLTKIYKKGDRICQLKITRVEHAEFYLVDELDATQRGEGGFGSTDNTPTPIVPPKEISKMIPDIHKASLYSPTKKYSDVMKEKTK